MDYSRDIKLRYDPENVFDELIAMSYVVTPGYTVNLDKIEEPFSVRPMTHMAKNTYVMTIIPPKW